MTYRFIPNAPAWSGLSPEKPDFEQCEGKLCDFLCKELSINGKLHKKKSDYNEIGGHYIFKMEKGDSIFLKVVSRNTVSRQIAAEQIASYLASRGLWVNHVLPGWPRYFHDHVVFAYPYIKGRFYNTTLADIATVGKKLRKLHDALQQFPQRDEIAHLSSKRERFLQVWHKELIDNINEFEGFKGNGYSESLRKIISSTAPVFHPSTYLQPIHGDFNSGNIMFTVDGGDVVVLDFEDATHSFISPEFDLAMAIERMIIVPILDDEIAYRFVETLLTSYQGCSPVEFSMTVCLRDILKKFQVRAICILGHMQLQGIETSMEEWKKFFFLYDLIEKRSDLIHKIESLFKKQIAT